MKNAVLWSYVLTASGATVMWLAASPKRHLAAWTLGVLNQILWGTFAFTTGQYGFVFGCLLYGSVYARNWRKAWKLRQVPLYVVNARKANEAYNARLISYSNLTVNDKPRVGKLLHPHSPSCVPPLPGLTCDGSTCR